ncbi:MAG TPA: YfiR family protein [Chryseosolibacter sp.]
MKTTMNRFAALLVILLSGVAIHDATAQVSNYKAYTLFVYNFTKYIQWPDGSIKDDFVIGVFGKSPILEELQKMGEVKKAGDKNIRVVEISEATLGSDIHILFVPEQKSNQIATILTAVKGKPVLLVSDKPGLVEKGAGISFLSDHNNLKFELNSNSIANQNLKISKTLEALAYKN